MRFLLSLFVLAALAGDQAALVHPFNVEDVEKFCKSHPGLDKAGLIEALPGDYKSHWIMMPFSNSEQQTDCHSPRFILYSPRVDYRNEMVRPTFAFTTMHGKDATVEMIGPHAGYTHFDFGLFHKGSVEMNPQSCENCHGAGFARRYNWDTYDNWPGMLPFNRDRIYEGSEEEKFYKRTLEEKANDPLVKQLALPPGVTRVAVKDKDDRPVKNPDGSQKYRVEIDYAFSEKTPEGEKIERAQAEPKTERDAQLADGRKIKVSQGGRFLLIGPASDVAQGAGHGTNFFMEATLANAERAKAQVKVSPNFERFKFALKAIVNNCVRMPEEMENFFPPKELTARAEQYKLGKGGFKEFQADVIKRRASLQDIKVARHKKALRQLVLCNAEAEGKKLSEAEIDERVTRELLRRDARATNHFRADFSDHERYDRGANFAQLFYLLQAEHIETKHWSLAPPYAGDTATFADLDAFRLRLLELVKDVPGTCAELPAKSRAAFAQPLVDPKTKQEGAHSPASK